MEGARRELERMRESAAAWAEVRYERGTDAEGYDFDRNAVRRARVLWALQFDRRAEDLELVRWLARQETLCRGEAPFQGLTEEINLAGYLLAEFRQVEDVWLQWEIKQANFDTWCGYDVEHLFAAGVADTLAMVRDSSHAERDPLLEWLPAEADMSVWWAWKRRHFPADPAGVHPLTWSDRAGFAGEAGLAREWLDRWADGRERDASTLGQLSYRLAELGAFAEAAAARRDSLSFAEKPRDVAAGRLDLAGLERQAGDHGAAWDVLREYRRIPDADLGRPYVEELFLLAGVAGSELAAVVFAEADRRAREMPRLPLVVLEAAADAAGRVGDGAAAERYRELRDAEERRIRSAA